MASKHPERDIISASNLLKDDARARKEFGSHDEISSHELKAKFPKLDEPVKEAVVRLLEERR